LTTQVARYQFSGVLANTLGVEEPEEPKSMSVIQMLYGFGLGSAALTIFWVYVKSMGGKNEGEKKEGEKEGEGEAEGEEGFGARLIEIMMNTSSMMFAWGMLFATRWLGFRTEALEDMGIAIHTMGGRVSLALFISVLCFLFIFCLDKIDDMSKSETGGDGGGELIKTIINAIGILVGLSWEHAFDGGVEAIASLTSNPVYAELVLAAFVALLIVPAWRKYILKKAMQLEDYRKEGLAGLRNINEQKQNNQNEYKPVASGS